MKQKTLFKWLLMMGLASLMSSSLTLAIEREDLFLTAVGVVAALLIITIYKIE